MTNEENIASEIFSRRQCVANRIASIKAGKKTYEGRVCIHHKTTIRYCRNHCCIQCKQESDMRRTERIKSGEYKKNGAPCWEQSWKAPKNVQWPAMQLEDVPTADHIGSRNIRKIDIDHGWASPLAGL